MRASQLRKSRPRATLGRASDCVKNRLAWGDDAGVLAATIADASGSCYIWIILSLVTLQLWPIPWLLFFFPACRSKGPRPVPPGATPSSELSDAAQPYHSLAQVVVTLRWYCERMRARRTFPTLVIKAQGEVDRRTYVTTDNAGNGHTGNSAVDTGFPV